MTKDSSTWEIENIEGDIDMSRITYKLTKFDGVKATSGALCIMVSSNVNADTSISNMDTLGNANADFIGAGVCRKIASNLFELTINSITYQFDGNGDGKSPSSIVGNYKILLGNANLNLISVGNGIKSNNAALVTRGSDGSVVTAVDYSQSSSYVIDSLNARDEFAVKALGQMLGHISNPADLSDNEMNFYCDAAYRWAANMMQASANARSSFEQKSNSDGSTSSTTTRVTDVPANTLSSNSEKLLNNIVAVLERTDNLHIDGDEKTYSKRVKLQFSELIDLLNKYLSNGESGLAERKLGIKDLITAINGTSSGDNLKELVNAIKNINITSADSVSIGSDGLGNSSMNPLFIQSNSSDTVNIGSSGLGRDKDHPIHMTGGGFPTRQSLAAALTSETINSMLTFNSSGAVGYSTLDEVKKAVLGWISNYKDLDALYTALGAKVIVTVDARVKAWLDKTTVVSNGSGGYKLNVPSSI